jgi:hypothetical protein
MNSMPTNTINVPVNVNNDGYPMNANINEECEDDECEECINEQNMNDA